jgi:hypothetical protein
MVLFSVFKGASQELPEDKQLHLLLWTVPTVILNQVVSKVPPEEVVHIHM